MSQISNLTPEQISALIGSTKSPCAEPCEKSEHAPQKDSLAARLLKSGFMNSLDLCFDDVKHEPEKLMIIGGCRQRTLAQHLALILPATEITLFDTEEAVAVRTKEEICCRFQFGTGPVERLAFPDETFDLVLAHNLFEFTEDWAKAVDEIARVTRRNGNFMLSYHQPALWSLFGSLPGMKAALDEMGISLPTTLPDENELLARLQLHSTLGARLSPFPWKMVMTNLKPVREEKLALAAS